MTPEGRAVKNGSSWEYEYNLKDHLGNTRAVIKNNNGVAQVIQERHYYPFGMEMSGLSSGTGTNKYLYNSKEYQNDFELDWYDYGARFYDPALGRFHTPDRFSEKYLNFSPYQYGGNNPIKNIDINGDSLMVVTMRGLDKENPQLKDREYYVDSKVGYKMKAFVEDAMKNFDNLSVNNVYRSFSSSDINTSNTKSKGLSRHQGGFAVDFNGTKSLSGDQMKLLNELAKKYEFAPILKQSDDPPHFDTDPTKSGYKSLKEAVDENKSHYDDIKQGKAEPIKFDSKEYEEYKKRVEDERL